MAAFLRRCCVYNNVIISHRHLKDVNIRSIFVAFKVPCTINVNSTLKTSCRTLFYQSLINNAKKNYYFSTRKVHLGKSLSEQLPYDTNTKVVKDVIMFKHDNVTFFKMLNAFALAQFFFWTYLSHFCFTRLRDTPVNREKKEDQPWWRNINLGENKYKNTLAVLCFILGYGILAGSWMFTLKSVRFLILRKGGKEVTFVTYGPFGNNRIMTVPLQNISCEESRKSARVQIPIKVKGHLLYYMLDMRGEFTNARLFDITAGLKRVWKN